MNESQRPQPIRPSSMIEGLNSNQGMLIVSVLFGEAQPIYDQLDTDIREIEKSSSWTKREGVFKFDDCFVGYPPAGAAHKRRVLAFSPAPDSFSLITANLQDGWNSLAWRLASRFKRNALILRFCSDAFEFPARSFSWIEKGASVRTVSVRLEDRWLFYQEGAPLPQEDTSSYSNRLIKSRLTNEQLADLAEKFDVSLGNLAELTAKGVLFSQT